MPFKITVTELSATKSEMVQATEVVSVEVPVRDEIERYSQTVDTLDIKRVIDAVNPSTRKKRAKKGE